MHSDSLSTGRSTVHPKPERSEAVRETDAGAMERVAGSQTCEARAGPHHPHLAPGIGIWMLGGRPEATSKEPRTRILWKRQDHTEGCRNRNSNEDSEGPRVLTWNSIAVEDNSSVVDMKRLRPHRHASDGNLFLSQCRERLRIQKRHPAKERPECGDSQKHSQRPQSCLLHGGPDLPITAAECNNRAKP